MMFERFEHWLDRIRRELAERRRWDWDGNWPVRDTRFECNMEIRNLVAFSERTRVGALSWLRKASPYLVATSALLLLAAPRSVVILAVLAIPFLVLNQVIRVGIRVIGD